MMYVGVVLYSAIPADPEHFASQVIYQTRPDRHALQIAKTSACIFEV